MNVLIADKEVGRNDTVTTGKVITFAASRMVRNVVPAKRRQAIKIVSFVFVSLLIPQLAVAADGCWKWRLWSRPDSATYVEKYTAEELEAINALDVQANYPKPQCLIGPVTPSATGPNGEPSSTGAPGSALDVGTIYYQLTMDRDCYYGSAGNGTNLQTFISPTLIFSSGNYYQSSCPLYFLIVLPPLACNCSSNNPIPDPISPATGAMFDVFTDKSPAFEALAFQRYYNSTDTGSTDLKNGWRHSYSRNVVVRESANEVHQYVQAPDYSSQYADAATACTSGFPEIQSRVPQWSGALASYSNGNCVLTKNGAYIGTLTVYSTGASIEPAPQPVAYDVTRDDGQLIRFIVNADGTLSAPPGISLRLQQTQSGFTITDANDNVEQYDASGKLLTVTSRGGVVQTMNYDSNGRLSSVVDSFGHQLIFSYDAQDHLSAVTRQ